VLIVASGDAKQTVPATAGADRSGADKQAQQSCQSPSANGACIALATSEPNSSSNYLASAIIARHTLKHVPTRPTPNRPGGRGTRKIWAMGAGL
jgi:hypothetical protein